MRRYQILGIEDLLANKKKYEGQGVQVEGVVNGLIVQPSRLSSRHDYTLFEGLLFDRKQFLRFFGGEHHERFYASALLMASEQRREPITVQGRFISTNGYYELNADGFKFMGERFAFWETSSGRRRP